MSAVRAAAGVWSEVDLPTATRDLQRLRRDLFTFGYCIIDRALEGDDLGAVQSRLFEQAAAERTRHAMKNPANAQPGNQWVGMLLNKGGVFCKLLTHRIAMTLIEDVLGADYLVSCVDAQIQHPGSGAMPLHTDQWWLPPPMVPGSAHVAPPRRARNTGTARDPSAAAGPISPVLVATAMWMITDFTEQNGATRLVPRSHLSGRDPDPGVPHPVATIAATGPAGTALLFDGRLWHGAGANSTDEPRYGITAACCAPFCRPLENYTRGMRPEVLARCPPAIRERLGFRTWSSYGHTGDPDATFAEPGETATGELGAS